ncbi:MAG: AmmeMemoRadiSam system radical SAM enzyme [Gemmatimonadota bacterium]|nr:AmmeMemoRadiSam system radical SAM enzyme [Gemmatimonadota bacterium]
MKESTYYTVEKDGVVKCLLCPHHCTIKPGGRGACGVRENMGGRLMSLTYGNMAAYGVDPIEKKPLFHFFPGSTAFSIATVGCNLSCPFCQNYSLSHAECEKQQDTGPDTSAEKVVEMALASGSRSVCFTYSEPTVFFEYMLDIAKLAKDRGLKTTMVSNGYIEKEPLEELAPFLDGANIDLKAFSERTYREVLKGDLKPVCDTIAAMSAFGIWCEVTTLLVPGMNDSDEELKRIASFLLSCGSVIPWHITRFHPNGEWTHLDSTPRQSLYRAYETGKEAGLKYVYIGNVPGEKRESTFCPACDRVVIERSGYHIGEIHLDTGGYCSFCGHLIEGVFDEATD